jgi:acylphosphatase
LASRLVIVVTGRVQGVAFRWYTHQRARQLGLVGTVRNLPDGSVRIVAEGNREALECLLAWASLGPDRAQVTGTEVHWSEADGNYTDFLITG